VRTATSLRSVSDEREAPTEAQRLAGLQASKSDATSLPFAEVAEVHRDGLRPSERRVVTHLLGLDPFSPDATADAVAQALGVSRATVVNAVQGMGYAGFADFRRRLIAEHAVAQSRERATAKERAVHDPLLDVCQNAMRADIAAIEVTTRLLDGDALATVAHLLAAAPYVFFVGIEWSGVLARQAAGIFTKYGIRATAEEIGIEQLSLIEVVDERTVVVAISHRGRSEPLLAVIERARERGLTIVALTHRATSRLAHHASVSLVCNGLELEEGTHPNQTGGPATYLTLVRGLAEAIAWLRGQTAS
jgi:RpiR family transcriptional regulator, carbohydrate utilization regulator